MNSSMPNTKPAGSPKKTIAVSAVEIEANRRAARQDVKEVVEGPAQVGTAESVL